MFEMILPEVLDKSPNVIKGDTIFVFWKQKQIWFKTIVKDVHGEKVILNMIKIVMLKSILNQSHCPCGKFKIKL